MPSDRDRRPQPCSNALPSRGHLVLPPRGHPVLPLYALPRECANSSVPAHRLCPECGFQPGTERAADIPNARVTPIL
jgi:hypothetical protein